MERTKLVSSSSPASRALRRVAARVSCPSRAARAPSVLTCHCALISRYESVIATLCENLDSLDEPEARAAMIWIVGEYAERIDNADELLESFLEGFHDESTQVRHACGPQGPALLTPPSLCGHSCER